MSVEIVLMRFGLAFFGAFGFGLVRQGMGKPIGFGTFIFLALGSCGLALTALGHNQENPLPLLSAIVTGVGFLGAGALFRAGDRVSGFTSAATIWIFAVFGLTMGVGEYLISGLIYASVFVVIGVDYWLAKRWFGSHNRRLTVEVPMGTTAEELEAWGIPPQREAQLVEFDRSAGVLSLTYLVHRPRNGGRDPLEDLDEKSGVIRCRLES